MEANSNAGCNARKARKSRRGRALRKRRQKCCFSAAVGTFLSHVEGRENAITEYRRTNEPFHAQSTGNLPLVRPYFAAEYEELRVPVLRCVDASIWIDGEGSPTRDTKQAQCNAENAARDAPTSLDDRRLDRVPCDAAGPQPVAQMKNCRQCSHQIENANGNVDWIYGGRVVMEMPNLSDGCGI